MLFSTVRYEEFDEKLQKECPECFGSGIEQVAGPCTECNGNGFVDKSRQEIWKDSLID